MRAACLPALCLALVLSGCSDDLTWSAVDRMIERDFPSVSFVSTDSLATRRADTSTARPLLLDARSPEEYAVSHLPGAHRVNPDADAFPALDSLAADAPIVVYCSVGYRSARVASRLQAQGFTNVSNLRGSIFRWANEGRPVVRNDSVVDAVHPYDRTWGLLLDSGLHRRVPEEPRP